jgi:hypothetical protein
MQTPSINCDGHASESSSWDCEIYILIARQVKVRVPFSPDLEIVLRILRRIRGVRPFEKRKCSNQTGCKNDAYDSKRNSNPCTNNFLFTHFDLFLDNATLALS